MNETEAKRIEARPHKVIIEGRDRITVSSVEDVDSFNENEVIFLTSLGMMTISGQDLHISRLNLEEGTLMIDGMIDSLDYADLEEKRQGKQPGLFSRVFR